jgi:hypothetical protein
MPREHPFQFADNIQYYDVYIMDVSLLPDLCSWVLSTSVGRRT